MSIQQTKQSWIIVGAWIGMMSAPVSAETLKNLYDIAQSFDATYLAAKAQAESVEFRVAQAEALNRPTVSLSSNVSDTYSDLALGGPRKIDARMVAINASQPLLNAPNSATVAKAAKSLDVARAEMDVAEHDLILRLAQAYFDVLTAEAVLQAAQSYKAAVAEQFASAKRSFDIGGATLTDTREAQARLDLASAQLLGAENDLSIRQLALDQLVGRSDVKPKPLAIPVVLPAFAGDDVETWTNAANFSAQVRKAQAGYEMAQLETLRNTNGHWPTLSLEGSASSTNNHGSTPTAAALVGGDGTTTSAKIGLTLNLPLYSGGSITNQAKEAIKLEEKARSELESARRTATQGSRQAFLTVRSNLAQIRALEAAETSSKLALESTQLGYKAGVRVNLDVLNAQTQLFTTQRDLAKARHELIVASLKLRQVAGTLNAADVERINLLIAP